MKILLLLTLSVFLTFSARAKTTVPSTVVERPNAKPDVKPATKKALDEPYIKTVPKDGVVKIVVLGDSLGNGLHQGMTRLNKDDDRLVTTKESRVNTGLVRKDRYDWNKGAKSIAKSGKYQVAIVLLGLNDLQSFRETGKAYHFKTEGWVERYQAKTEEMMRDLKDAGLAVYWVSIPIVTPKRYQQEYEYLNSFYKNAAEKIGVKYIDTWSGLAGADGKYSPFYTMPDGKTQNIRMRDGVHFTPDGYLIFAGFVNDTLQKDLQTVLPPKVVAPPEPDTEKVKGEDAKAAD